MCCWESLLVIWDSKIHSVFVLQFFLVCYPSFLLHLFVVFLLCFGLGFLLIYKWVLFWFGHDAPFRTILCFWFMLVCFLWFCSILKLDTLWFEDTTWHTWHITPKARSFNTIWWLFFPQHTHNAAGFNEGLHSLTIGFRVCRLWV